MKGVRSVLFSFTISLAVLAPPWTYLGSRHIGEAYAQAAQVTVTGTLDRVGTFEPLGGSGPGGSQVRVQVHIDKGMCDSREVNDLYIIISSGSLADTSVAERNSLNMKNAYSTLLTALLSGKTVEIFGPTTCTPTSNAITMALGNGTVSIIPRLIQ